MVLQHSSVGIPTLAISYIPVVAFQCRDFPQSYAVILLAVATSTLFHSF